MASIVTTVLMLLLSVSFLIQGNADALENLKKPDQLESDEGHPSTNDEDTCLSLLACLGSTVNVTEEGTICLPAFGENYINNLDCSWRVSAPIGSVVRLDFTDMDTEECSSCSCDYVSVYDGSDSSGNMLAKLCGSNRGTLYYSHYQDLFLHFSSDHTFNARGFKVKVSFITTPRIAFHATLITSLDAISESVKVIFHDVDVNDGDSFDLETSDFTCKVAGTYFFSISAGAQARKQVQLILRKNRFPYVSIVRSTAEPTAIEMMSRSVIMELNEGDVVDVLLFRYTSIHSDDDLQTSFLGFHLPFVNEHDAALFVARPDNITFSSSSNIPGFEKRIVDIGHWGNDTEHTYMSRPHDGFYYQELSSGQGERNYVRLYGNNLYSSAFSSEFGSVGYTTLSLSHMSNDSAGDQVWAYSNSVGNLRTNSDLQMSISSFIIATEDRVRPFFRAYRTSSSGTIGNIPFSIEISHDISFNEGTGTFTCLIPGIYFVHVSCGTTNNSTASYITIVSIMKNGQPIARLTRYITDELYYAHISRNILVELNTGDELYLGLESGLAYSNSGRQTTFSAILLYEQEDFLKAVQQGSMTHVRQAVIDYMDEGPTSLFNETISDPLPI